MSGNPWTTQSETTINHSTDRTRIGASVYSLPIPMSPGLSLIICFSKKLTCRIVAVCSHPFHARFGRRSQSLVSSVTRALRHCATHGRRSQSIVSSVRVHPLCCCYYNYPLINSFHKSYHLVSLTFSICHDVYGRVLAQPYTLTSFVIHMECCLSNRLPPCLSHILHLSRRT